MKAIQDIIIAPVISESSMRGVESKHYVFKVRSDATKPEIAKAVETMFKVKVASVNTINMKRKQKRLGVHVGYTSAWKKAFVTLTESSKPIEFFEGLN